MGFGERLAAQRKAKELSQEALGKALAESLGEASGTSKKQAISHWEKGRYQPSIEQIAKLCELLDCSADYLILGKAPEDLPPDALLEAKFFARLTPAGKAKWRALRPVFAEPASDKTVEAKMPVTAKTKVTHR